jgi:hypothetical protein
MFLQVWCGVQVLTRPRGTFNDQGGLVPTVFIVPLTLCIWLSREVNPLPHAVSQSRTMAQ